MKKFTLLLCLLAIAYHTNAQSLSYLQLQNVFNVWMQGKATTVKAIDVRLKAISPKWKITSFKPITNDEEKYFVWTFLDTKKDTTALALYIEEDATTVKYTLKYAFHNQVLYNSLVQGINASSYYKGNISTNTDKGETTLFARPDESLPMRKRIDMMLSDYNLNANNAQHKLYTVDIFSRYIPK